jgi:hypothetical protein
MRKVIDFYKKAQENGALKADLEAASKTFAEKKESNKDVIIAEVVKIAAKHGISLKPADLELKQGELDENELAAVAGGYDIPIFYGTSSHCFGIGRADGTCGNSGKVIGI